MSILYIYTYKGSSVHITLVYDTVLYIYTYKGSSVHITLVYDTVLYIHVKGVVFI